MYRLTILVVTLVEIASAYNGTFISGTGDVRFLKLLDIARRMWSNSEIEYQSIGMLYRGDWDGLLEGPTWGGWWTQNSYGTTMTALPLMDDVTFAALSHSQAWWFNSIGNGTRMGMGSHALLPGPDGCLCDAAVPKPTDVNDPQHGEGCYYKQGDGNVAMHDWTIEESLSAVVMQAELLLVSRNRTAIRHYMPLFWRTAAFVENRRHAQTGYTTFLTGPSSNLLAPSFGGGPNGTWSYHSGVSVTYTAALNRMIELASMEPSFSAWVPELTRRRDLNLVGISKHLLTTGEGLGGTPYLVRSVDPADGLLHGKVGQHRHGYFEASPNHDAVAFRVVNASIAEGIMHAIDRLGSSLRPNTFVLPNTDAGGGVGYDDMLNNYCTGAVNPCPPGPSIFVYGQWVNGGVWSTQEGRLIMAYYRTGRPQAAAASFEHMLQRYASDWKMDAPLPAFGNDTWSHLDTMLTIDAFAHSSALLRGLFEPLYGAETMVLLPHLPDNLTEVQQHFGLRWGPYRLFISATGVRSSGVTAVYINGATHEAVTFNDTAIIFNYSLMPAASLAAMAAMDSDVSIASDVLNVHIDFKHRGVGHTNGISQEHFPQVPCTNSPRKLFCKAIRSTCAKGKWPRSCGLNSTESRRLTQFLAALNTDAMKASLPYAMASSSQAYMDAFDRRCAALNAGQVKEMADAAAAIKTLQDQLSAAGNMYEGLNNTLMNRYALSKEPLAHALVAAWVDSTAERSIPSDNTILL